MTRATDRRETIGNGLGLIGLAGVIVWLGVFMNWAVPTFGAFDARDVGLSTFAWPLVVLAACALTLLAPRRSPWNVLAWLTLLALTAILVDETVAALRDGEVAGAGLRLGLLMGAQLLVAAAGVVTVFLRPARG